VKLLLPIWMAGFILYGWPFFVSLWREERRHVIGPALLFAALVAPSVRAAVTVEGMARGRTVLAWYPHGGRDLAFVILNNYLSYFDGGMLFVRGGPAVAQSIPGLGLWNLIDLPLMIAGLVAMARNQGGHARAYGFIAFWFALGPLPGGVTYETRPVASTSVRLARASATASSPCDVSVAPADASACASSARTSPSTRTAPAWASWNRASSIAAVSPPTPPPTTTIRAIRASSMQNRWDPTVRSFACQRRADHLPVL